MKIRSLGILGGIALLMLPGPAKAGSPGRPLSSFDGTYSATAHGNFAFCLESPSFIVEVSCTSSGAVAFPITEVDLGQGTRDKNGHACTTFTTTDSDLTPGTSPTQVGVGYDDETITSYDPTTQSGDQSYLFYSSSSGKCVGAKFVSSGTPVIVAFGTYHFVVSANGTRVDLIFTAFADSVGGLTDFAWALTELQQ